MESSCCALYIINKVLGGVGQTFHDRLAAQKLIYIIQKLFGKNLGYSFMWYTRGPYSRSLAKDLRSCSEECECLSHQEELEIKDFLKKLQDTGIPLFRALEIVASYIMLREDVYPRPEDPIKELIQRKPYITMEEVLTITEIIQNYTSP